VPSEYVRTTAFPFAPPDPIGAFQAELTVRARTLWSSDVLTPPMRAIARRQSMEGNPAVRCQL